MNKNNKVLILIAVFYALSLSLLAPMVRAQIQEGVTITNPETQTSNSEDKLGSIEGITIVKSKKDVLSLESEKTVYTSSESPVFNLTEKPLPRSFFRKLLDLIPFLKKPDPQSQITVLGLDAKPIPNEPHIQTNENGQKTITLPNENFFKPGKLKMVVQKGKEQVLQEFLWGVLAINTNKSIYLEGETAYLQMGVLDDTGHTVCNAQTELEITSPSGAKTSLSSDKGTIEFSKECAGDTVVSEPDYFANYKIPQEIGKYQMHLTANTKNGQHTLSDSFEVRSSVDFDVERVGPTRIFPKSPYSMKFNITSNTTFKGQIKETVPKSFEVVPCEAGCDLETATSRSHLSDASKSDLANGATLTVTETDNAKALTWQVDWQKGKKYTLSYEFDAPDISPEFYLLGPLSLSTKHSELSTPSNFSEIRRWQIASDALDSTPELITQEGYIFENDDEDQSTGDAVDDNTQLAGSTFASEKTLTSVKKGERITVRTHIKNTGTGTLDSNLALFYDRNDGIFTKVESDKIATTGNGSCATAPQTGSTNFDCTVVDDHATDDLGSYTSLAFDASGNPWISYRNNTTLALVVAQYVGSGGNCDSYLSHTGSDAWNCTVVDDHASNTLGTDTSLAFDASGNPWISYYNGSTLDLVVAQYVGSGGDCDSYLSHTGSDAWECTVVDEHSDNLGQYTSLAFDPSGNPWISYYNATTQALVVAQYVGSGGDCDSYLSHTGSDAWECTVVDDHASDSIGSYTSLAFDASGNAWVSYQNSSTGALVVASYVGSGGDCDSYLSHTGSDAWECTVVDDHASDSLGFSTSLAFDAAGNAWVSYKNNTTLALVVAQYVGSGGDCDSYLSHTGSDAWECTVVDDHASDSIGSYTSLAFDASGNAWVSYQNSSTGALKVAKIRRGGEITVAPGVAGNSGDALNESHVDMINPTNYAERDDADCLTATTWNSGKWFESEESYNLTMPAGSSTSQCTEVSFVIDTSQAVAGTTYRLVLATKDGWRNDKGVWRGPIAVSTNAYPTLTIESSTTGRFSKDNMAKFTDCTSFDQAGGSANWGCLALTDGDNTSDVANISLAFDASGNPWVAFGDYESSQSNLTVAQYVGSGGNCDGFDEAGGSDAWQCTTVTDGDNGLDTSSTSLAFDASGNPWVAFGDYESSQSNLTVAQYVGSGGNCDGFDEAGGSDAWQCTTVFDGDTSGDASSPSLAFDASGNPWVAFENIEGGGNLTVAQYVGSGGNCDGFDDAGGSDAWQCTTVTDGDDSSDATSISFAFDASGNPWVAFEDLTDGGSQSNLTVAQYVGSGGNCDGFDEAGGSDAWQCTTVFDGDTSGDARYISLAFDASGNPWVAIWDVETQRNLTVAQYVGSGGNCDGFDDPGGSDAWQCTTVFDGDSASDATGISFAFDASGNPWVSFENNEGAGLENNLTVAQYVGSGGNCDGFDDAGGSDAWQCTTVIDGDNNSDATSSSLAFDHSGNAWVAIRDVESGAGNLAVAKLHLPPTKPSSNKLISNPNRSAKTGDARYRLDIGKAPASESGSCSSTTDRKGYCGLSADDSDFDGITALPAQRPIGVYAVRNDYRTPPTITWIGRTNLAPSTASTPGDLKLEVYRFGTTNAWEALVTDSASSDCSSADCRLSGAPTGPSGEYYEAVGSNYWVYFRLYQIEDGSTTITLKTDYVSGIATENVTVRGKNTFRGKITF